MKSKVLRWLPGLEATSPHQGWELAYLDRPWKLSMPSLGPCLAVKITCERNDPALKDRNNSQPEDSFP